MTDRGPAPVFTMPAEALENVMRRLEDRHEYHSEMEQVLMFAGDLALAKQHGAAAVLIREALESEPRPRGRRI